MTERVDFYVLKRADSKARNLFACRLAEKAYLKQHQVLMLTGDESAARELDELLWTFNDDSFVPHAVCRSGEPVDPWTPVYIGTDPDVTLRPDLVLNMAGCAPDSLQRFTRIAEIIDADEERKRLGRDRFKIYRDAKIPLETHQFDE